MANNNKFELFIQQLNIKPENNIYRCYGRLENAPLSFESRFPIILSKEHKLAKLIILYVHSLSNHVGVKQTVRGCSYGGELARLIGLACLGEISPSLRNSYKNIMCSYEK